MRRLAAVALLLTGCGGEAFSSPQGAAPVGCTPGEQRECVCAGGAKSVQVCEKYGAEFGACECADAPGREPGPEAGTLANCGGKTCAPIAVGLHGDATCVNGECRLACPVGYQSCDFIYENGCECFGSCVGAACAPR